MTISETENTGRFLRPRQFVALPDFITEEWDRISNGRPRGFQRWDHPELANLAARLSVLASTTGLSDIDGDNVRRVEKVLCVARDYYSYWFEQMDFNRFLPDAPERPEAERIAGDDLYSDPVCALMPSWESYIVLLGALHRCRDWVEASERKFRINTPTAASVIDAAYGSGS